MLVKYSDTDYPEFDTLCDAQKTKLLILFKVEDG